MDEVSSKLESNHEAGTTTTTTTVESSAPSIDNCYCKTKRTYDSVELQCMGCLKWFHDYCIKDCPAFSNTKCVPFMTNYFFNCKKCSSSPGEVFIIKPANIGQMCITAIANLMVQYRGRFIFSKDNEIIRYIEKNWESLTSMPRRKNQTWHSTVLKNLKDDSVFSCEENYSANGDTIMSFGLVVHDLHKIGPNYENLPKGSQKDINIGLSSQVNPGSLPTKSRGSKRKGAGENQSISATKKPKSDLTMPKLPPHGYPLEHPFNKDGYRYILAEPDPHAPYRQEFDESLDWAGKPIPGFLYRALVPNNPLLALHDRAPQLKISDDRLTVTGEKGYCMVRSSVGVNQGTWYCECKIEEMPTDSATRLGWSQALGNLQAPLGYDNFSYSYRSRKGTTFHLSKGKTYGEGYKEGDVIGMLISLSPEANKCYLPLTYKEKPLVKFKSHLYYEDKDEVQATIKNLKAHPRSSIKFYKNGVGQGVAWMDINAGTYYPAASLYKSSIVSFNYGPKFRYPPKKESYRSIKEASFDNIILQTISDLVYLVENEGSLQLSSFYMT